MITNKCRDRRIKKIKYFCKIDELFFCVQCINNHIDHFSTVEDFGLDKTINYSEKLYCDNNYKDQLLRIHHQNKWKFPQYITIHFEGPPHKRKYIMGVEKQEVDSKCPIENRWISFGIGSSKKEGEQNAAKMALIIYGILNQVV